MSRTAKWRVMNDLRHFFCVYVTLILIGPAVLISRLSYERKIMITYYISDTVSGTAVLYNPHIYLMRWVLFHVTNEKLNLKELRTRPSLQICWCQKNNPKKVWLAPQPWPPCSPSVPISKSPHEVNIKFPFKR